MFERFSEAARRVVVLAHEEAGRMTDTCVGSHHLLLGIILDASTPAADVLTSAGATVDPARQAASGFADPVTPVRSHLSLTPSANQAINVALREAGPANEVTPEHLILGLLADPLSRASQVLKRLDIEITDIRDAVRVRLRASGSQGEAADPHGSSAPTTEGRLERPRVFLSYRRTDSEDITGRIYDRLVHALGRGHVFLDVDSLEPGRNLVTSILAELAVSDHVVVIMGPGWLDAKDPDGRRRIDQPNDYVRLELESALAMEKSVVPVLVHDASMPRADDLPIPLRAFATLNAGSVRHGRFPDDMDVLLHTVSR